MHRFRSTYFGYPLVAVILGCGGSSGGGRDAAASDASAGADGESPDASKGDAAADVSSALPPGAKGGKVTGGVTATCTGDVYEPVAASDCGFLKCTGSVYALCVDNSWSACDCSIPPGYVQLGPHP
jgi:hypothetical protein